MFYFKTKKVLIFSVVAAGVVDCVVELFFVHAVAGLASPVIVNGYFIVVVLV